jgi:hypothetical protein
MPPPTPQHPVRPAPVARPTTAPPRQLDLVTLRTVLMLARFRVAARASTTSAARHAYGIPSGRIESDVGAGREKARGGGGKRRAQEESSRRKAKEQPIPARALTAPRRQTPAWQHLQDEKERNPRRRVRGDGRRKRGKLCVGRASFGGYQSQLYCGGRSTAPRARVVLRKSRTVPRLGHEGGAHCASALVAEAVATGSQTLGALRASVRPRGPRGISIYS